jgi:CTP synthase (UTP-ammonia lyase)
VLGIVDAAHLEYGDSGTPFVTPAHCEIPQPTGPRIGGMRTVRLADGTKARGVFGAPESRELFACSFELNRAYYDAVERAGMRISGRDDEEGARVVELPDNDFHVATLFLPQMTSTPDRPHPLFLAYVRAALEARWTSRITSA